ncbi:MAG: hypothetical protein LBD30_04415 [Verrucomicrobiales bacterium]|nr:hypothetical protein [Verrucomicrobiales bacterium]
MSLEQIDELYGQDARHAIDGRIISFTVDGYKFRLNNVIHGQNFLFREKFDAEQFELNLD